MVFDFSTRLNDVVNPFVTFGLNKIDYTIVKLDLVDVAKLGTSCINCGNGTMFDG